MVRHALRAQGRWRPGERFDAAAEMGRLTLAIAAETMFGADLEGEAEELGRALTDSLELFDLLTVPFSEQLLRLPLPRTRRFHAARERLDRTIYRLIAERRARGEDRGDLLSMLLEAQDAEGDEGADGDMQLRDEALTLFLAGHETTANALAWTWFLLAQHPAVERRLHAELDAVLGGRPPTVGDLPRLRYARMVLSEAMRLYPPAWAVARLALEDYRVGPYTAPRGSIVLMSQWVTHRDPRWWPEPERFDPDRWTPEGEAGRPRFSYFPFGGGPRVCIGEAFAWMEGTLVMAAIGQRWRLRLAPGARVAPRPLITLRPRDGMPMLAERR
jgi:cytochrome P450